MSCDPLLNQSRESEIDRSIFSVRIFLLPFQNILLNNDIGIIDYMSTLLSHQMKCFSSSSTAVANPWRWSNSFFSPNTFPLGALQTALVVSINQPCELPHCCYLAGGTEKKMKSKEEEYFIFAFWSVMFSKNDRSHLIMLIAEWCILWCPI